MQFVCDPGDVSGAIRETTNFLSIEFVQRIISSVPNRTAFATILVFVRNRCSIFTAESSETSALKTRPCPFPAQLQENSMDKYKLR
ncbi:hypothetical protein DPMN_001372 [Dreissena polymorpha]|uniref:Uncharacterized protein n=1 Tax=Dreissena polymorpha TaxID=45954 RepID=A0A9D4RSV0_DREPO|nr:hypothetical protein DPMN_001372 [Dreissena polymorpha]